MFRRGPVRDRQVSLRKAARRIDLGRQGQSVRGIEGLASRVQLRRHPKNAEHQVWFQPPAASGPAWRLKMG